MNSLQPWLESVVCDRLEKAVTRYADFLTPNGNLEIEGGKGRFVQVIAFHSIATDQYHYATVSDGKNSVRAKIRTRDPREPTQGTIISVKQYQIVLDPTSNKSDRLLFEVKDFKVSKSETLSTFGTPVDILKGNPVSSKISQLKAMVESLDLEMHRSPSSSPFRSQPQAGSMEPATQILFSTQIRFPRNPSPAPQPAAAISEGAISGPDALIKLLAQANPKTAKKAVVWQDNKSPIVSPQQKSSQPVFLSQISEKEVVLITSKLDSRANIRQSVQSQDSLTSEKSKRSTTPRSGTASDRSSAVREPEGNTPSVPPVIDSSLIQNPFQGQKRVPRRFVRVSRDQQKLLDRGDAWYAPLSNSQQHYATLPHEVREHLLAFASRPAVELGGVESSEVNLDLDGDSLEGEGEADEVSQDEYRSAEDQIERQLRLSSLPNYSPPTGTPEPGEPPDDEASNPDDHWTSSPEAHQHQTLATMGVFPTPTFDMSNASNIDGLDDGDDAIELPRHSSISEREKLPHPPRVLKVQFPNSSSSEHELEEDELHAIGDPVEAENGKTVQVPETSQDFPSTAGARTGIVEVEQSPFVNTHTPRLSGHSDRLVEAEKPVTVSSDGVVPATCADASQHATGFATASNNTNHFLEQAELENSTSADAEAEASKIADDIYLSISNELEQEPNEASLPFLLADHEFTSSPPPLKHPSRSSSPRNISPEVEDTLPRSKTSGSHTNIPTTPVLSIPSVHEMQPQPQPSTSALARPHRVITPVKQRRYSAAIAVTLNEEPPIQGPKEMARAKRHQFLSKNLTETPQHDSENPADTQPSPIRLHKSPAQLIPFVDDSIESRPGTTTWEMEREEIVAERMGSHKSASSGSSPYRQVNTCIEPSTTENTQDDSLPQRSNTSDGSVTDFYQAFKIAYPKYQGSVNGFTWTLVYMEWLSKNSNPVHRSLCDDFIHVVSTEFVDYVGATTKAKAVTGCQFYAQREMNPEHSLRIVTPENLGQAISTLDQQRVDEIRLMFSSAPKSNVKSQKSVVDTMSRNQVLSSPIPRPQQNSVSTSSNLKSARHLPWKKNTAQASSSGKVPVLCARSSSPTLAKQRTSKISPILRSKRDSPASPILGSGTHESPGDWDQVLETLEWTTNGGSGSAKIPRERGNGPKSKSLDGRSLALEAQRRVVKRKIEHSPSSIGQPFKRPKLPFQNTPTPAPLHRRSSALPSSAARPPFSTHVVQIKTKRPPDEAGWAKFVRRQSSTGSLSRLSTPASTPGKRYCVKPKAVVLPTDFGTGSDERARDGDSKALNSGGGSRRSSAGRRTSGEMSSQKGKGRMMEPETQAWDM
ncbi:hypothetical protein GLAREA_11895 [Glarea lozoyensis ATCC 20868]|uniref:Telomere replication protein EST3 n=1 Tax=Glarea lozoyensis (strain ATCC 20868 / MF5171) TaxID=1116229 RepID=S3DZU5_GLAL2|nr:uncharacterized protein GLAREA_11895 [Glarea lozoyensis ATCC 20868]EPE31813.1 hypothetical protein GLAREA_11895 [Glarea lozoyensis ATCC 20868]